MAEEGFQDFLEEAQESLTDLEENITTLSNDENLVDNLNFIFRHIHSIKGASSFFKFESLAQTSHKLENLLDQLRKHERELTQEIKDTLSEGFFLLQEMVERGLSNDLEMNEKDITFIEKLTKVLEGNDGASDLEKIYNRLKEGRYETVEEVRFELEAMLLDESSPDVAPPLHPELNLIKELLQKQIDGDFPEATPKIKGKVQELLVHYVEEEAKDYTNALRQFFESYKALVDSPVGIDEMLGGVLMDELYAASPELVKADETIAKRKVSEEKSSKPVVEPKKEEQKAAPAGDASVRIKVPLLEEMMNLMGELVLSRNQLKSYTDHFQEVELNTITQNISTITSDLQEKVMKTRLQPVSIIFKPLPGVVREISRKLNKKVKLVTEGESTELDRSILNGIKDPLTHVLRNSLDHGIEPYEDRVKTTKPDEATIKLKAYHEGSQVVIEISDDGRGVNVEKVKSKALENGLMSAEELSKLSEQETCMLIFKAGFSTADQVSEVSGRGVGMDVVRSNIENLGGHIELDSQSGKGTVLKFKIPLTLAIIPALVVEAGGVKYSIPQESLVEMVLVKAGDLDQKFEELNGTTVFRLRGKILPVVNLNELLGVSSGEDDGETLHVIVLNTGGNLFGLVVSLLHDIEEIVVKSLDHFLENHALFSGATILGDGSISLILDTLLIAERFKMQTRRGGQDQLQKSETTSIAAEGQVLTFRLTPRQVYGVMLDSVYRLENVKSSRIESLAGKWFLQYRGGVLPLISSWEVMGIEQGTLPEDINIIVFVEEGQEMGLVVGTIDDTMPLTHPVVTDVVVDPRFLGSSIVNQKVITILSLKYLSQQISQLEQSAKERVMLWDDSDLSGEHAERLREQGYDVEEVKTKKEADDMIDAQVIDIVVTTPNLNQDDVKAFSKHHGSNVSMMSYQDVSVEDLDYQEKLDPTQLSEGLKDLGQSK